MRNTKDIADAVFRIRDEYLEQKKLKHIHMKKACTAVSAVAAVSLITAGVARFYSFGNKPVIPDTDNISVSNDTTELTFEAVTSACVTSAAESTHTTSVTAISGTKTGTTVSSVKKGTSSRISSTVTQAASYSKTTVTTNEPQVVATELDENDCMEVIRMKVINVKKYLAALSAAAIASGGVNMPVYAEELYTPKELDPLADCINYIEENTEIYDFDGSGKIDPFDAYALFTYVNEPSSLPEGYAERCEAKGDVNKDGKIDSADSDLISEIFIYKYSEDQFRAYYDSYEYLTPWIKNSYEYITRSLSADAPEDVKERLKNNEFLETGYSYGSDKNIYDFVDLCFDIYLNGIEWEETFKYNDAYYKRFADDAKSRTYSFDVNEDGVTDLKDLYDIFIYDSASADVFSNIQKNDCFMRYNTITTGEGITEQVNYNFDVKLRDRLTLSEAEKQKLWEKCEPIYDYVYSFIDYEKHGTILGYVRVFDMIGRYIMNDSDLNYLSTTTHTTRDLPMTQRAGITALT